MIWVVCVFFPSVRPRLPRYSMQIFQYSRQIDIFRLLYYCCIFPPYVHRSLRFSLSALCSACHTYCPNCNHSPLAIVARDAKSMEGDEIDFSGIDEDLEQFQQDDIVRQALRDGVDLRGYARDIDLELREVRPVQPYSSTAV